MRKSIAVGFVALAFVAGVHAETYYRWVDSAGRVHYTDVPPPVDARQITEGRFSRGNLVGSSPSYSVVRASQDFPVTLYTDTVCQQACTDARSLLQKRGVPFTEVVIKTDDDVAAFREKLGSKDVSVPTLLVGKQTQIGLEEGTWNRMLDDAGYPRTAPPGTRPPAPPGDQNPQPASQVLRQPTQ